MCARIGVQLHGLAANILAPVHKDFLSRCQHEVIPNTK